MDSKKMISWGLGTVGTLFVLMASVPFETARSNLATWSFVIGIGFVVAAFASAQILGYRVGSRSGLAAILTGSRWRFHYNVQRPGLTGAKDLTFNRDGTIGDGRNGNENQWKVVNGNLEIRRANGGLQNRFSYDRKTGRFDFVPDAQAQGFKDQWLESIGPAK